jgi:hypothetical protein
VWREVWRRVPDANDAAARPLYSYLPSASAATYVVVEKMLVNKWVPAKKLRAGSAKAREWPRLTNSLPLSTAAVLTLFNILSSLKGSQPAEGPQIYCRKLQPAPWGLETLANGPVRLIYGRTSPRLSWPGRSPPPLFAFLLPFFSLLNLGWFYFDFAQAIRYVSNANPDIYPRCLA